MKRRCKIRIISKKHDYYDIGMGLGQDLTVVYLRETVEIKHNIQYYDYNDRFSLYKVGFCGRIYPLLRAYFWRGDRTESMGGWCYSLKDCDDFIEKLDEKSQDKYFGRNKDLGKRKWRRSSYESYLDPEKKTYYENHDSLKIFFENFDKRDFSRNVEMFHTHNSPIIVWEPKKTIINPLLKPYEFYRVKSPYDAFQEIQQYVGGILLANTNPIPLPDDLTKIELAGFDKIHSFRKEPKSD